MTLAPPPSPFYLIFFFLFIYLFIFLFLFIILFYFCFPKTHQPSLSLVDHQSVAVDEPLLVGNPFLGQSSLVSHYRLTTPSPFLFIIIIIIIIIITITIYFLYFLYLILKLGLCIYVCLWALCLGFVN